MMDENTPCYTEIVTLDTYRLRSLGFTPDVIFDIGANIGVFTNFVRELFPSAKIVAVEPHPANYAALRANAPRDNVVLLEKALGSGRVLRYPDILDLDDEQTTTAETYISEEFGFTIPDIGDHALIVVPTKGVMLDSLCSEYVQPGQRLLIKVDCEGAENILFVHQPSIDVLRRADYVTMELHPYWATRTLHEWAPGQTEEDAASLASRVGSLLSDTHRCTSEPPMFYARKRGLT